MGVIPQRSTDRELSDSYKGPEKERVTDPD